MLLQRGFEDRSAFRGGYVSIGNFDGVHRGHRQMISVLVGKAKGDAVPAVVLTFDPHPIRLLRPQHAPPSLSTLQYKAELLGECGVDCVIAYPTDEALLDLTPDEFFDRIVRGELDARGLVEGANFFFGRDRAGDIETLRTLCDSAGISLDVVPPVHFGDRVVSSSAVRADIAAGRMAHAVRLLGHPYRIHGVVARGADRGGALGFPTANLEGVETLLPADGVYAGVAHREGRGFPAAINVGHNPTFGQTVRKLEVHLVGFAGDLYGQTLEVDFLERLRDVARFDSADELQKQLARDVQRVEALAERHASD